MTISASLVQTRLNSFAILAGCFVAIWGVVVFGWLFAAFPFVLVLGAILQPRSPLPGKWLMRVGALLLSLVVFPVGIPSFLAGIRASGPYPDRSMMTSVFLSLASVLLLALCDALLLFDIRTGKNTEGIASSSKAIARWLVWAVALFLTLYLLAVSRNAFHAYLRYGRFDVFLTWASMSLVVLCFDVALVIQAAKAK